MIPTDEIIKMARKAGMVEWPFDGDRGTIPVWDLTKESLTAFAALVSARAAAIEREACAKICDQVEVENEPNGNVAAGVAEQCAEAIRARKP